MAGLSFEGDSPVQNPHAKAGTTTTPLEVPPAWVVLVSSGSGSPQQPQGPWGPSAGAGSPASLYPVGSVQACWVLSLCQGAITFALVTGYTTWGCDTVTSEL